MPTLLRPPSPSFALLRLRPSSCCVPSSSSSFTSSPYLRDPFFCLRALSLTSRPPRLSNATAIGRRRRRPEAREHESCGCRLGIDERVVSCVLPVSVPTADAIEASEGVRALGVGGLFCTFNLYACLLHCEGWSGRFHPHAHRTDTAPKLKVPPPARRPSHPRPRSVR